MTLFGYDENKFLNLLVILNDYTSLKAGKMQSKPKTKTHTVKMLPAKGIVSAEVKNYSNDPFVIKKVAAAIKRIERVGFPKEFIANR